LAEIASVFNVTEARICQIHTQALAVLKKNCQSLN
jgi:DNA-directed RNA polymerase specialized sigma subunit